MLFFIRVTVKASYVDPDSEFRAVWVTPWGGDSALVSYTSEAKFKANMNYILNIMEEYNMNVMIYHIRTHNNALYNSDINPLSSYWSSVNFNVFDPLTWLIDECHLRGIEFHAWLNPYRVSSSYSGTVEEFAATVQSNNVASDASNLLKTTGGVILTLLRQWLEILLFKQWRRLLIVIMLMQFILMIIFMPIWVLMAPHQELQQSLMNQIKAIMKPILIIIQLRVMLRLAHQTKPIGAVSKLT